MPVSKAVVFNIIYFKKWKSLVYNKNPLALQSRHLQHWFTLYSKSMKASGVKKPLANVFACSINWLTTNKININCYKRRCHSEVVHCMIVALLSALSGMLQTRRQSLYLINGMLQSRWHPLYLLTWLLKTGWHFLYVPHWLTLIY